MRLATGAIATATGLSGKQINEKGRMAPFFYLLGQIFIWQNSVKKLLRRTILERRTLG
jgi:hypothetical protein